LSRLLTLALIIVMIGGAVLTYSTKHDALLAAAHVADLRNQIERQKINLSLLKAEWSAANQPARLEGLINRNQDTLHLAPFGVERMVRLEDLPSPAPLDAAALERLAVGNPPASNPSRGGRR
jgi:hypothetical protein